MAKKAVATDWDAVGNEVIDGLANVCGGLGREIAMTDSSWNQRACERVGDAFVSPVGMGAFAGSGLRRGYDGVSGWADHYRDFEADFWPYNAAERA